MCRCVNNLAPVVFHTYKLLRWCELAARTFHVQKKKYELQARTSGKLFRSGFTGAQV